MINKYYKGRILIMVEKIDLDMVRNSAFKYYTDGDFYCSEAVVLTIKEVFDLDYGDEVVRLASGFAIGMGGSGCVCGAVVGANMAIGMVFGRDKAKDRRVKKTLKLSKEVHDYFKEEKGSLCCRVLTRKFKKFGSKEHKEQCALFTGELAYKTAEVIARELKITAVKNRTEESE